MSLVADLQISEEENNKNIGGEMDKCHDVEWAERLEKVAPTPTSLADNGG